MQFGLLFMMYAPAPSDDERLYREVLEQVEEADRLGYDIAWFAEHHFEPRTEFNGRLPAPMLFIAAAASRTRRIKLGTGVRILPIHDPIVLAEEAAVADLLTGGRLVLGAGQGGGNDFETFGINGEQKYALFRETLDVMAAAWRPGVLNHESESFRYQGLSVIPKPLQRPEDIIWVAARNPELIQYAGRSGYSQLIGQSEPTARQADYARLYREAALAAGHTPRTGGTRVVYVGQSDAEARAEIEACIWRYYRRQTTNGYFKQAIADGLLSPSAQPSLDEVMRMVEFIVGGPETVAEQLATFCDALQVSSLTCMTHIAGITHDQMLRSMRLFMEEVKPRLLTRLAHTAPTVESVPVVEEVA